MKSIRGVDTAELDADAEAGEEGGKEERKEEGGMNAKVKVWNWRGSGWLKVASSRWEVLGYGLFHPPSSTPAAPREWALTFFASTIFSPAGIDIYSRDRTPLPFELLEGIKGALEKMEDEGLRRLGGELYEVVMD